MADVDFAKMLASVTTEPGKLNAAYSRFHNYSLGNQILAIGQLSERNIPLGPIASFNAWKDMGRFVKKGEKAIELCMPVTCKRQDGDEETVFTRFIFKRNWFALAQTDGHPYYEPALPEWDRAKALQALGVTEVPFAHMDGNCQGYAKDTTIAISPVAAFPLKTTFHECAHVIIGHTSEGQLNDDDRTPRNIRELEAEATAMLVCAALGLPGIEEARGYVQHWFGSGEPVPEASARRIFKAADAILKAGK